VIDLYALLVSNRLTPFYLFVFKHAHYFILLFRFIKFSYFVLLSYQWNNAKISVFWNIFELHALHYCLALPWKFLLIRWLQFLSRLDSLRNIWHAHCPRLLVCLPFPLLPTLGKSFPHFFNMWHVVESAGRANCTTGTLHCWCNVCHCVFVL